MHTTGSKAKSEAAMSDHQPDTVTKRRLRALLLELAHREDNLAADELAAVPYWSPCPSSVLGHRSAAHVLRTEADTLLDVS